MIALPVLAPNQSVLPWLTALLVGLALLAPSNTASAQQSASELEQLAEGRYIEDDLTTARYYYIQAARVAESSTERARLLVNASWIAHLAQDADEANRLMDQALTTAPGFEFEASLYQDDFVAIYREATARLEEDQSRQVSQLIGRGVNALETGDLDTARRELEAARAANPNHPLVLYNLALLEERSGNLGPATDLLQRLLSLEATDRTGDLDAALLARVHAMLGQIFLDRDLLPDAAQSLERAIELSAGDAGSMIQLGTVRYLLGDLAGAADILEQARERRPDDPTLLHNLALVYLAQDRYEDTIVLFERFGDIADRPTLLFDRALAELGAGQDADAMVTLRRVVESAPGPELARPSLDALLPLELRAGRHAVVVQLAQERLDLGEDANAWYFLGLAHSALGDQAQAIEALQRSLALDPNRADTANNLGDAFFALERYDEAVAAFEQALAIDPNFQLAQSNLEVARASVAQSQQASRKSSKRRRGRSTSPPPPPQPPIGVTLSDDRDEGTGLRAVRVNVVQTGSRADVSGLRVNDLILRIDGTPVPSADELAERLATLRGGDSVILDLIREGSPLRLELRLGG